MPTRPRMHTKIHTHRGAGALRMDHYQVLVPDVLAHGEVLHGPRLPHFRLHLHRRQRARGRHVPAPQGQSLGHRAADALGAALPPRRLRGRSDRGHRSAPATSPATSALPTASSTGPGATAISIPTISMCAIRTATAPNCCCPASRSSTSTTSRCAARSSPKANSNLWGLPAPRTWVEEATSFAGVEIRRPPVEGEPMTAEKYLAARIPEAVVS